VSPLAFATHLGLRPGPRTIGWDDVLALAVSAYWRKRAEVLAAQRAKGGE
jgi:hypothetical protein